MSESSQPSDRLPKDPPRIVYHAEKRTFARLFNERSLGELKDVVRRKLGLGQETDVSLKQILPDALLDLEDDGDFRAFRVFLKSSVSVDIQVTVGTSQSAILPPVAPQPQEQSSVIEPPVLPSKEPPGQSGARPSVARAAESVAAKTTSLSSVRKRKVSFGDVSDISAQQSAQPKLAAVPSSVETAEAPAAPEPTPAAAEEPPKKRLKKEIARTKDVQATEGVESSSTKAPGTLKHKTKRSTAPNPESEAGTSASRDGKASDAPTKKSKKSKKGDSAVLKEPSRSDQAATAQPISQPSDSANDSSFRLELLDVSKSRQGEKIGVCDTIPRTSASASVQSEVAAAILSGYLSKASESTPAALPAKRTSVKKSTRKSAASSSASLPRSTTVSHAPADGLPIAPTAPSPGLATPTNELPQQITYLDVPPCPICLEAPFHIRYRCPIVLKGPDAIRDRLEEVKGTNLDDQQSLIEELEGLLRDPAVASRPSLNAVIPSAIQSRNSKPLGTLSRRAPNIPSDSRIAEVMVESRDEGSSSESSDDVPERRIEHDKEISAPGKRKTSDERPPSSKDALEAAIRDPVPKRQSVLHLLDRIVGDDDDEDSDSEEEEVELEEDTDEEVVHPSVELVNFLLGASDSESESEESRSPSPLHAAIDKPEPGVGGPKDLAEEHHGDDVVMASPPPLGRREDDSSEETHVGSEDRVVEKDAGTIEGQTLLTRRVPVRQSSDAPSNNSQGSGKKGASPASHRDVVGLIASKALDEAEADPIEPADNLALPADSHMSNADPIEASSEGIESLFSGVTQSTPKPGITKRIKTRNGQILADEAERPILLEQLASGATEEVTTLPTKGKSRRKVPEASASQELATARKNSRLSSLPPATSTPAAAALLNRKTKVGTRSSKAAKTSTKTHEQQRADASQSNGKDDDMQKGARITATLSLTGWEALTEVPSSPLPLDEPSAQTDELTSSSPQLDSNPSLEPLNVKERKGRSLKSTPAGEAETPQGRERLFDLSSSQVPFPYSQRKETLAPTTLLNGKERAGHTDSEDEAATTEKKARLPTRYRSLSQLASQATTLFSPILPTPVSKPVTHGKTKRRVAAEGSSSSSSSSDEDEDGQSEHIPRGQKAGSALGLKKKKRKVLSTT